MRRANLPPNTAPNEGARCLRALVRRSTIGRVAKRLRLDESTVRRWAHGAKRPAIESRELMQRKLGIAIEWWDDPPGSSDVYDLTPATERRTAR